MRQAGLLIFFLASLDPLWASADAPAARDTIVIDGVTLDVEAQVRFDSMMTNPRENDAAFQAAWTVCGLVGNGGPPTGWRYWSGSSDVNVQFSAELLRFPARLDRRKRIQWQAHFDAGFMMTSLTSIDEHAFPDSLIGFLPATAVAPLRMVTSQQFDIGTETDTLDAITGRTVATAPFAFVGLDAVWGEWHAGVKGGVRFRMQSSQDRPTLNGPTLNGPAFVPGLPRDRGIEPMIQAQIGYQKKRSPWTIQLTGLWISESAQNQWWGVGVKYDAW